MNLSLELLADQLAELNPVVCRTARQPVALADVRLLASSPWHAPDYLVVCTWEELRRATPASGLCVAVIGEAPEIREYLEHNSLTGLILGCATDRYTALGRIQDVFLFYRRCLVELAEAVIREAPLVELLNVCARLFGNPTLIADASLSLMAASTIPFSAEVDQAWQRSVTDGIADIPLMNELKRRGLTAALNTSTHALLIDPGPVHKSYISANVFDAGVRVASLAVVQWAAPLTSAQLDLADRVVTMVGRSILKQTHSATHHQLMLRECLEKLVQGSPVDEHVLSAHLSRKGWKIDDAYVLLRIVWPAAAYEHGTVEHSKYVYARWFVQSVILEVAGDFVILVHPGRPNGLGDEAQARLSAQLEADGAVCGASLPFGDLRNIRSHFQLAGVAARHTGAKGCLRSYADILPDHLFAELAQVMPLEAFCHPQVMRLQANDRQTQGKLVRSLLVYLQHERSLKAAAQELQIHRNSLVYRINRIEQHFGLQLNDAHTRQHALFSCLLLDYLDRLLT